MCVCAVALLDFYWSNRKFKCVPSNGISNCRVSDDGQTVTAVLKHVDGHNGTYELQEVGGDDTVTCMFSHREYLCFTLSAVICR